MPKKTHCFAEAKKEIEKSTINPKKGQHREGQDSEI
jgi:hypothetical protein